MPLDQHPDQVRKKLASLQQQQQSRTIPTTTTATTDSDAKATIIINSSKRTKFIGSEQHIRSQQQQQQGQSAASSTTMLIPNNISNNNNNNFFNATDYQRSSPMAAFTSFSKPSDGRSPFSSNNNLQHHSCGNNANNARSQCAIFSSLMVKQPAVQAKKPMLPGLLAKTKPPTTTMISGTATSTIKNSISDNSVVQDSHFALHHHHHHHHHHHQEQHRQEQRQQQSVPFTSIIQTSDEHVPSQSQHEQQSTVVIAGRDNDDDDDVEEEEDDDASREQQQKQQQQDEDALIEATLSQQERTRRLRKSLEEREHEENLMALTQGNYGFISTSPAASAQKAGVRKKQGKHGVDRDDNGSPSSVAPDSSQRSSSSCASTASSSSSSDDNGPRSTNEAIRISCTPTEFTDPSFSLEAFRRECAEDEASMMYSSRTRRGAATADNDETREVDPEERHRGDESGNGEINNEVVGDGEENDDNGNDNGNNNDCGGDADDVDDLVVPRSGDVGECHARAGFDNPLQDGKKDDEDELKRFRDQEAVTELQQQKQQVQQQQQQQQQQQNEKSSSAPVVPSKSCMSDNNSRPFKLTAAEEQLRQHFSSQYGISPSSLLKQPYSNGTGTVNSNSGRLAIPGFNNNIFSNNGAQLQNGNNNAKVREINVNRQGWYGLPDAIRHVYLAKGGITKLHDWQNDVLTREDVCNWHNLVYSLPTSGGKSLVAEICMLRCLRHRRKHAMLILPFVAIVEEKVDTLRMLSEAAANAGAKSRHHGDTFKFGVEGYFNTNGRYPPPTEPTAFVCTIEKASGLINHMLEEKRFDEIGVVVVDELHMVGGSDKRAATLEMLLAKIVCGDRLVKQALAEKIVVAGGGGGSGGGGHHASPTIPSSSPSCALRADAGGSTTNNMTLSPSFNFFNNNTNNNISSNNDPSRLLTNGCQLIGMSATVPNLPTIAQWLCNAACYIGTYRPTPLAQYVVRDNDILEVRKKVSLDEFRRLQQRDGISVDADLKTSASIDAALPQQAPQPPQAQPPAPPVSTATPVPHHQKFLYNPEDYVIDHEDDDIALVRNDYMEITAPPKSELNSRSRNQQNEVRDQHRLLELIFKVSTETPDEEYERLVMEQREQRTVASSSSTAANVAITTGPPAPANGAASTGSQVAISGTLCSSSSSSSLVVPRVNPLRCRKTKRRYADSERFFRQKETAPMIRQSTLIFCASRADAVNCATFVKGKLFSSGKSDWFPRRGDQHLNIILQDLKRCSSSESGKSLPDLIRFGVAFHIATLTGEEREIVERAYKNKVVLILFATSTLAAGVNLPARRVIIRAPFKGMSFLKKSDYLQMCGRAGRAGFDTKGECFIVTKQLDAKDSETFSKTRTELIFAPVESTRSAMECEKDVFARALLELVCTRIATTLEELYRCSKNFLYYFTHFTKKGMRIVEAERAVLEAGNNHAQISSAKERLRRVQREVAPDDDEIDESYFQLIFKGAVKRLEALELMTRNEIFETVTDCDQSDDDDDDKGDDDDDRAKIVGGAAEDSALPDPVEAVEKNRCDEAVLTKDVQEAMHLVRRRRQRNHREGNDVKEKKQKLVCVEIKPTNFGIATVRALFTLDVAQKVKRELERVQDEGLIMSDELHICYFLTPAHDITCKDSAVGWGILYRFFNRWHRKDPTANDAIRCRIAERVGLAEGYLHAQAERERMTTRLGDQEASCNYTYERFWNAMQLHDLLSETPHSDIIETYQVDRTHLVSLQQSASTFAGCIVQFCTTMEWHTLAATLSSYVKRIGYGVKPDLIPLMELAGVSAARARILWTIGFKTVKSLADASAADLHRTWHEKTKTMTGNKVAKYFRIDAAARIQVEARRAIQKEIDAREDEVRGLKQQTNRTAMVKIEGSAASGFSISNSNIATTPSTQKTFSPRGPTKWDPKIHAAIQR